MKQEVSSCHFAVRVEMMVIKIFDNVHNLHTQVVGMFIVAKTSGLSFFLQKQVDAVCQSYQSKHGCETISVDKAFLCQEVILKEAALFYFKFDTCIHVTRHNVHHIRQLIFLEILDVF